LIFSLLIRS